MSPDKTELRSYVLPEGSKKNRHLPRWLLNPVFAARLTLATMVGLGASAGVDFISSVNKTSAATQCTGSLNLVAFRYFDRNPVDGYGQKDEIDDDDFALGPLPEQVVYLFDKDKHFLKDKVKRLELKPSYSKAKFEIKKEDNINCDWKDSEGVDRATFYYTFETDLGKFYRINMGNGKDTWSAVGIKEDSPVRLEEYLLDGNRNVLKVGNSTQLAFKDLTGNTAAFLP